MIAAKQRREKRPWQPAPSLVSLPPPAEIRRASFGSYLLACAMITAALSFYVHLHVTSLRIGYRLTDLRQQQLKLVLQNRALKTEVGTLTAPARMQSLANGKLGMVAPQELIEIARDR